MDSAESFPPKNMIESLPPGFLVGYYSLGSDPHLIRISPDDWEDLKKKGFCGGLVLPEGMELKSLSDEELREAGLQRTPT